MIKLDNALMTGALVIDAQEKNQRAIGEVERSWSAIDGKGTIIRSLGPRSGDYALEYKDGEGRSQVYEGIRVETKWLSNAPNDLFSSLSSGYARIKAELQNLSEKHPLSLFIAEGKASDFQEHRTPGGVLFKDILNTLFSLNAKFRVPVIFSEGAADWVTSWLFACVSLGSREIETYSSTKSRPFEIFTDHQQFMTRIGKRIKLGTQFFLGFKAPKGESRRLSRLMALNDIGLWFFDGAGQDQLETYSLTWLKYETKETELRASGGFPPQPQDYSGNLRILGRAKGQYLPKGSQVRMKRKASVLFKNSAGEDPVIVLFETPRNTGSEIQLLKPRRFDGESVEVSRILSMRDLNPVTLEQICKIRDKRPEMELIPNVLRLCYNYWSKLEESEECLDTSAESLGSPSLESGPIESPAEEEDTIPERLYPAHIAMGPEKPSCKDDSSLSSSHAPCVMEEESPDEQADKGIPIDEESFPGVTLQPGFNSVQIKDGHVKHYLNGELVKPEPVEPEPTEPVMFNPEPFKEIKVEPTKAISDIAMIDLREEIKSLTKELKRANTMRENLPVPLKKDRLLNEVSPGKIEQAMLDVCGLGKATQAMKIVALKMANRYGFSLELKHVIPIKQSLYITRDGLLHIAHKSGQFDGMEVKEEKDLGSDGWSAKVSVYRKDMGRPFTYTGRYNGPNKQFGPEMAVKCAECMALRRAFDVSICSSEERWDVDQVNEAEPAPVKPEPKKVTVEPVERKAKTYHKASPTPPPPSEGPDHRQIIIAAIKKTNTPMELVAEGLRKDFLELIAELSGSDWKSWRPAEPEAEGAAEYVRFFAFAAKEMCLDAAIALWQQGTIPASPLKHFTKKCEAELRKIINEDETNIDIIYDAICDTIEIVEVPF